MLYQSRPCRKSKILQYDVYQRHLTASPVNQIVSWKFIPNIEFD